MKIFESDKSLKIPVNGSVITYVYNSNDNYDEMDIYPALTSGRVCPISDSIKISSCNQEISLI